MFDRTTFSRTVAIICVITVAIAAPMPPYRGMRRKLRAILQAAPARVWYMVYVTRFRLMNQLPDITPVATKIPAQPWTANMGAASRY